MALEVGIVGLPRSGKTTLFNALTGAHAGVHEARAHVGIAPIRDERLHQLARLEGSARETAAHVRVEDVPGTGAALLGNLRHVHALLAVLDGFTPESDPARDAEQLRLELLVADRDHVEKRLERVRSQAKSGDPQLREEAAALENVLAHLDAGGDVAGYAGDVPAELEPLTTKPLVVVENGPGGIDLQLEAELVELPEDEAVEYRDGPSALEEVVRRLEEALDLIAFFTANEKEARAWTLRRGQTALQAAGQVHSDFARGFVRCEVVRFDDLVECGSRAEAARRGLLRLEGKDYAVADGDVLQIRAAP